MSSLRDGRDVVEALRNGLLRVDTEQTTLDKNDGIHSNLVKPDDIRYSPTPTGKKFHKCDDLIRGLMGPYGSGKSVACVMEHYYRSAKQQPTKGNVRWTRSLVLRNTAQELRDTTISTVLDWMPDGPDGVGTFLRSQQLMMFRLGIDKNGEANLLPHPSGDGTFIACDMIFRAIDRPEQQRKLLSAEYTFAWINEFREVPYEVITALSGRIGRFPGKRKTTWRGIWMDTNPFSEDSQYDKLFAGETPQEVVELCEKEGLEPPKITLFEQPSGLSPEAENLQWLDGGRGYYIRMLTTARLEGRSEDWINVHVHGKRGSLLDGRPVWAKSFNRDIHVRPSIAFNQNLPLYCGMDFGLTPAAVFGQYWPDRRFTILGELTAENAAAAQFAHEVKEYIRERGWDPRILRVFGDPAGRQRAQTDLRSVFDVLRGSGLIAQPARHQSMQIRIDSVRSVLQSLTHNGDARILFDREHCAKVLRAVASGYVWSKNENVSKPTPAKNSHSHIADALQYLISEFEGSQLRIPVDHDSFGEPVTTSRLEGAVMEVASPW